MHGLFQSLMPFSDSNLGCNLMSNGQTDNLYEFHPGRLPLLISFPHSGVWIPDDLRSQMTSAGLSLQDTDWFLPRLYRIQQRADVSSIIARPSRYLIDLNRSPDGESLYPGQSTTGLCPEITFDRQSIYQAGREPQEHQISQRRHQYWQPYHQCLQLELERLIERHGKVVLLDAHSIASRVPMLFEGVLPDFNMGTQHGTTCDPMLSQRVQQFCRDLPGYTHVDNGRFIGGYITRHYGQMPGVNSLQLELSQATYLDESDASWHADRADRVASEIHRLIEMLLDWSAR